MDAKLSARVLANKFADEQDRYGIGTRNSRMTWRAALLGAHCGMVAVDALDGLTQSDVRQINGTSFRVLNARIETVVRGKSDRNKIKGTLGKLIRWLADKGYVERDVCTLLKILRQSMIRPAEIKLPTKRQIEVLETEVLGATPFRHKMNWLTFVFLALINALRPMEILNLNEDDIDTERCRIRVHRKGGQDQYIYFQRRHLPQLGDYLDELRRYKAMRNASDEPALIIKLSSTMGRGLKDPSWRLTEQGLCSRLRALAKKYPVLRGLRTYWLRHQGCSTMAFNAVELGGGLDETAHRNGHSVRVLLNYYYGFGGRRDEALTRTPAENIELFKGMINRSLRKAAADPQQFEHLCAATEYARDIGRLQKALDLQALHDGELGDDVSVGIAALGQPVLTPPAVRQLVAGVQVLSGELAPVAPDAQAALSVSSRTSAGVAV